MGFSRMKRLLALTLVTVLLAASPAHADFAAGKAAYDTKKWDQAIINLRPLAESGDARAMVLLANMYSQGYGVTKSQEEAYKLYHRAALAGNGEAMVATGAMLQQGAGVSADVPLAIEWYKRAAETGQPGGAFFYALYLYQGNKTSTPEKDLMPDHPASYQWMRITEKHTKDPKIKDTAGKIAAEIAKTLTPEDIAKADTAVTSWKPRAVTELGPAPGMPATP